MLALTRPRRQVAATLVVLLFLVLPTAYIALSAWKVRRPGHAQVVAVALGRDLGVQVSLAGVAYPRPGEAVYRGIVLRREEPGRKGSRLTEFARAETLHLRREGNHLTLEADGLRLRASGPRQALAQIGSLLQRVGSDDPVRASLTARTCEIELGPGLSYGLGDVAGALSVEPGKPSVTVSYRLIDGEREPRCELVLVRDRRGDAVHSRLTMRTAEGLPLPGRALDPFFDSSEWLGPDARVEGELELSQQGDVDWDATFRGTLHDLDLATVAGRVAPAHRWNGRARLDIEEARWGALPGRNEPGWVEAKGTLRSPSGGTIGTPLLQALASQLRFRIPQPMPSRPEQSYESMGLAFAYGADGQIRIRGALGDEHLPGAVMVQPQRRTPLASAPEGMATFPGLIRALVPNDGAAPEHLVPARHESFVIHRYLPVPSVRPADVPASARAN